MSDAIFGTRSSYGFTSMFKEDSASEVVQAVFGGIYHFSALRGLKADPMEPKAPRFACVDPQSAQTYKSLDLVYDPWQRCLAGSPRRNPLPAFYAEETAYIFLCPAFFAQEDKPDRPHCPVVDENRFAGDPNIFYKKYQVYTILYNLLRFYLGDNALSADTDPREELDWNNCVRLNPENSVRNPTNFQIYAASESHLFLLLIIHSSLGDQLTRKHSGVSNLCRKSGPIHAQQRIIPELNTKRVCTLRVGFRPSLARHQSDPEYFITEPHDNGYGPTVLPGVFDVSSKCSDIRCGHCLKFRP